MLDILRRMSEFINVTDSALVSNRPPRVWDRRQELRGRQA